MIIMELLKKDFSPWARAVLAAVVLADASLVDGAVNAVWKIFAQWSLLFRRVQTGLIQNYALMMLFGVGILVGFFYIYFW
jgi:hypothetical protein